MLDRTNKILELLTENTKLDIKYLSEKLNVSQVTVRKDLDGLEKRNIVKREHGYAVLLSKDNIAGRMAYHYDIKVKIAKMASTLINDGDTIMIESGSCCALLAETLCSTKKDLKIITNSAFIAELICSKSNFEVILLGGIFQKSSKVMVGPMVRECVCNFYVEKFFIGTDSYSNKTGFTNQDQLRGQAVKDMSIQSDEVVVLTESEKFRLKGTIPLNIGNKIKLVITDNDIDSDSIEELNKQGIEVKTV